MDRARLLLMALILVGITSCASLIVNSNSAGLKDRRCGLEHCPLHGDRLVDGVVRMDNARWHYVGSYYEVKERLFWCSFEGTNNANDAPVRVSYCPTCRLAHEQFLNSSDHSWREPPYEIDEFIASQRRELQERHPETQFVDAAETLESAASETALETDTPEWVE